MTPIIQALWAAEAAEDLIRDTVTGSIDTEESSGSITLPIFEAGDKVLLFLRLASGTATIHEPTGWEIVRQVSDSGNSAVLSRVMEAGDPGSVTVEWGLETTLRRSAWTAYAFPGAPAVEQAAAPISPPTITPSWGEEETTFISFVANRTSNQVWTPPTNYGDMLTGSNGYDTSTAYARATTAHRTVVAASETPGVWTLDAGTVASEHYYTIAVRTGAA